MKFNEKMTVIADNIRSKTGGTEALSLDGMASGVNEVYDKGRTDEWSDFWDAFQLNGTRTDYIRTFSGAFNNETFKPKYDFKPTGNCEYMFYNVQIVGNFKGLLENCGVVLDTSKAYSVLGLFNNAWKITHLPEISFESATTSDSRIQGAFMGCYDLVSIDKVIYPTDVYRQTTNTFQSCRSLTHLRIGGVIGNNFNVSWSPLDVESVKDVILHLKDYSTDTENKGKYTLTLSDTSKTAMSELGTIPELNNKTYDAYLTDIGWNLA